MRDKVDADGRGCLEVGRYQVNVIDQYYLLPFTCTVVALYEEHGQFCDSKQNVQPGLT